MSSTTDHTHRDGVPTTVASIPLTDVDARMAGQGSIGALVKDATTQVSTLVRAEVELAKSEITAEVKKGVRGGIFFAAAGVVGLFSLFFLFFTIAEVLDLFLPRWVAFGIVFLAMLLVAGVAAFLGYRKVKTLGKPEKTIDAVKDNAKVLPRSS
ncbi:phage holin family protein [Rhodococcus aerolatus]